MTTTSVYPRKTKSFLGLKTRSRPTLCRACIPHDVGFSTELTPTYGEPNAVTQDSIVGARSILMARAPSIVAAWMSGLTPLFYLQFLGNRCRRRFGNRAIQAARSHGLDRSAHGAGHGVDREICRIELNRESGKPNLPVICVVAGAQHLSEGGREGNKVALRRNRSPSEGPGIHDVRTRSRK